MIKKSLKANKIECCSKLVYKTLKQDLLVKYINNILSQHLLNNWHEKNQKMKYISKYMKNTLASRILARYQDKILAQNKQE